MTTSAASKAGADMAEHPPALIKRVRAAVSPSRVGNQFVVAFGGDENATSAQRRAAATRVALGSTAAAGGLTVGVGEAATHFATMFTAIGHAAADGGAALTSFPGGVALIPAASVAAIAAVSGRATVRDALGRKHDTDEAVRIASYHADNGAFLGKAGGLLGMTLAAVAVGLDATLSHTHNVSVAYHDVFDTAQVMGSVGATFAVYGALWRRHERTIARTTASPQPTALGE